MIKRIVACYSFGNEHNQLEWQGGICGEKQWGINIKIEEKLTKNGGKSEEKLIIPRPLGGTISLSSLQIPPCL